MEMMKKICFEDPPRLKNESQWDPLFIDFVKQCMVKDPQLRPDAEKLLQNNNKFFSLAKGKASIKESLLKGVPSVEDRVINYN